MPSEFDADAAGVKVSLAREQAREGKVARKLLATTFSEAPWGIALTALDGSFLEANAAYCRMVGYTLTELRKLNQLSITHADDRAEHLQWISAALTREAGAYTSEGRYLRKGGEIVKFRASVSLFRGDDHEPIFMVGIFEDLTERHAAAEQLRQSQSLVEIAGRVAQVGGWSLDLPDRRLVWSDIVAAIHDEPAGFSPSLAQGIDYFVPEHRDTIRAAVERCIRDGTPYDLELEKITSGGRRFWVRTIGQAERDAQGRIARLQGAFQEISNRKQSEQAASELANRLRTTLESITDAFYAVDSDWRFTYVNAKAEDMFGRRREDLIDRVLWQEFPPLLGTDFERGYRRSMSEKVATTFEAHYPAWDTWFQASTYPSELGLTIYLRDVSAAHAARQRLELLEASVSQLNDIVLITEANSLSEPGPRIVFANEAFTRITGHASDEVLGKSPRLLQGALTDRSELDRIRGALSRFEPVHSELVNYTKSGVPYWIEMDIVPVGIAGGAYSHFVAVERDVSDRKRAQQAVLESRQRLRLLNKLSDATRTLADPAQTMATASRMLGQHMHASVCAYAEVDADGERFKILQEHIDGCTSTLGSYRLSLFGARARAALDHGRPLIIRDVRTALLPGEGGHLFDAIGIRAIVCCPLTDDGGLRAMMLVMQTTARDWRPREVRIVLEVAERSWSELERRSVAVKLRESEALLRIAGRTADLGGWAIDLPGGRVSWSDEVCAILKVPAATAPTLDLAFSFYVPQSRDVVKDAFEACVREGAPFDLELEMITAEGHHVWVRCTGEALFDNEGAVTRVQGALQDITERKHTEMALRESESELRTMAESMPQIVWITKPDGSNLFCNQKWMDYTGLSLEDSLGAGWSKPFHPEDQARAWSAWQKATAEIGTYTVECRLRRADGAYRWWLIRGVPQRDATGKVLKWFGTCTDVHDLKLAEQEISRTNWDLQRQRTELRVLFDLMPAMIWFKDTENGILRVNQRAADAAGLTVDAIEGKPTQEIYPEEAARYYAADLEVIRSGRPKLGIVEKVHDREGNARWVQTDKVPYRDKSGNVIGLVVMAKDITQRVLDQNALRELNADLDARVRARTVELNLARDEAERANQAKSAFLAVMSHEIRTPMNGVIGMIEVLSHTSLKGHQVEMIDLIRDSAFSLLQIIEDILDFSKIEAGKLNVENRPLQLANLVENVCSMLGHIADKQRVRLTMFIDPEIPTTILGDESRLRQVLVNLAGNAIKFSTRKPQTGHVSVRMVLVEQQAQTVTVELIVSDDGIGIDDATLARLFTPFSQADSSTTRRFGGSGLGLAITSMLVRLMDGVITVRSAPDQGAEFTVRLSFAVGDSTDANSGPMVSVAGLRCRIVGEELPLADDLAAYLAHAQVIVERSPDLAHAAAVERPPGLCLWLILPSLAPPTMPELRHLSRGKPDAETRFIVLGWGRRRRPRVDATDLVLLDADVMLRRTLLRVVGLASGNLPEDLPTGEPDGGVLIGVPPRQLVRPQNQLILVAEDNETNGIVIRKQLGLLGHAAEVVVNGREALERWRSGDYALLLTDLHMPLMDGYALTQAIRAEEAPGRRIPIIALTANALRDEELRCRAAGMDAYLSKPVRMAQLKAAIDAWLAPSPPTEQDAISQPDAVAPLPVDLHVLESLVGDDPAVTDEVLQSFCESAALSGAELREGVAAGSKQAVMDAAHKLKAAARSIGALRLGDLCAQIEQAAVVRGAGELTALMALFEAESKLVMQFINSR